MQAIFCTQKLLSSSIVVALSLLSSVAIAQQYSGAGATNQYGGSYNQHRIQQRQVVPPPQYYYQPAPPAQPPQTRYVPHPLRIPGMTPVPVQLSPQDAEAMGGCLRRGAGGVAWGWAGGGPRGAIVEGFRGCLNP